MSISVDSQSEFCGSFWKAHVYVKPVSISFSIR